MCFDLYIIFIFINVHETSLPYRNRDWEYGPQSWMILRGEELGGKNAWAVILGQWEKHKPVFLDPTISKFMTWDKP